VSALRPGGKGAALLALLALAAGAVVARAEPVRHGDVQVSFSAKIAPKRLPRDGLAAISATVGGRVIGLGGKPPPQLRSIAIATNSHAHFDLAGLPGCDLRRIQPATTSQALRACGDAKVGEGSFAANVIIPTQSPFPSRGKLVAFNGREGGHPVIFAHVFGTDPIPTSYTLSLRLRPSHGTYGTVLEASLPKVTAKVAYITEISLTLGRRYRAGRRRHSYLSAGCPAPAGFSATAFPLARTSFGFAGGLTLSSVLTRSCRVRG